MVYLARQTGLNRTVALKMVRPDDQGGGQSVIRFLAEAEAVAAVRHPYVVQVYEYGEHAGRPFLALEYLGGGSLADRLRAGRLDPRAAAELVGKIAAGVGAAHELGIVHRDLKPSNVLLDENGEPKVTDFGLAKRGRQVELTQTGAVLGTPGYMAPEQVAGRTKFVGPTADVWSLGVILYEALTGGRPFRAEGLDSLYHQILTADPPAPRRQARDVPRDLELVCLKCLEKEPHHRYPTAAALAADLGHFLRGEPVTARPLGPVDRLARWARRNPVVAGLLAVVLVISAALVGSVARQYRQALDRVEIEQKSAAFEREAKERAEQLAAAELARRQEADRLRADAAAEAARANEVSEFLAGMFRSSDPLDVFGKDFIPANYEKLRSRTARDFLDDAAVRFRDELKGQPLARAKLLTVIGNSYRNLGEFAKAAPLLAEARALRRAHLPADHPDVTEAELLIGKAALDSGDLFTAEEQFKRVLDLQTAAGADEKTLTHTRSYLGWAMGLIGRPAAPAFLRKEIAVRERLYGKSHYETLFARIGLVATLFDQARGVEALPVLIEVTAGLRDQQDGQTRLLAEVVTQLQTGIVLSVSARASGLLYDKALAAFRDSLAKAEAALPPVHYYLALIHFQIGLTYVQMRDDARAEAEYRTSLDMMRKTCGVAHPRALVLVKEYSHLLARRKRAAEGRALFDEVAAANRDRFGPDNYWQVLLLLARAEFEVRVGDHDAGDAAAREALRLAGRHKLIPNRATALALWDTGRVLGSVGRVAVGHDLITAARPLAAVAFGDPSATLAEMTHADGRLLYNHGRRAEGARLIREAAAMVERLDPSFRPEDSVFVLRERGSVGRDQGAWAEAERHFRRAAGVARTKLPATHRERHAALIDLAGVLAGAGKFAEAAAVVAEFRTVMDAAKAPERDLAGADRLLALVKLAGGDHDRYRALVRGMAGRYGKSADPDTLARLAGTAGLAPGSDWDPKDVAARLKAAGFADHPRGARFAALAPLRAGDPRGAEDALAKVAGPPGPFDHAVRGLAALARGDAASARDHLRKADELVAAQAPSERNPFAYADTHWADRLDATVLIAELRSGLDSSAAPPPLGVGR
jgi:tetratricopeptide (TPR) repeat protein